MFYLLHTLLSQFFAGFIVAGTWYFYFGDELANMSNSQRLRVIAFYMTCALFAYITGRIATRWAEARVLNIYPLVELPKIDFVWFHWIMAVFTAWIVIDSATRQSNINMLIDTDLLGLFIFGVMMQPFTFVISCIGWTIFYGNRYSLPAFDALVARSRNPFNINDHLE